MTEPQKEKTVDEGLENYLAGRLIAHAENNPADKDREVSAEIAAAAKEKKETAELAEKSFLDNSNDQSTTEPESNNEVVAVDKPKIIVPSFTKVEKSLASLAFFTPSSRRIKNQKIKRISFVREVDGKRVEASAEIIPSALYGLPITADQDKYLALQEIITNILATEGEIKNPIRFKSADLLRLMNRDVNAGKNYKEISAWLDVMFSTTIFSSGTVFKAGEKCFAKDRFRVFDRAVSVGKELDDGTVADANYVWLSQWQLDNINHNYLLPVDIKTYRELKNHIAKALVPLLQIWLFASRKAGTFEKRYDELCEMLGLQKYKMSSLIIQQLKPSLDELTRYKYLASWKIERTTNKKAFKVILAHGPKFHRDRRKRLKQKNQIESVVVAESQPDEPELPIPGKLEAEPTPESNGEIGEGKTQDLSNPKPQITNNATEPSGKQSADLTIITELTKRGVFENRAREILKSVPVGERDQLYDYIDYWDSITAEKTAGLLIWFIESKSAIPASFETRRQREARLAGEAKREKLRLIRETLSQEYNEYRRKVLDRFISDEIPIEEFKLRINSRKAALAEQTILGDKRISSELAERIARSAIREEIAKEITMLSFEDFRNRELPRILADLNLPAELGNIITAKTVFEKSDTP